ncbi:unnamed protein product [Mycena citricolor]|uniref:Uncharacterized protein n=1 Tax=Mycena citricolor TaxID=2018698 RepID=A0AAD2Q6W6_9AGAR|nr:unnamed protein product [Mycena citricolor]
MDYQCALINWNVPVSQAPDLDTGMWAVEPERQQGTPTFSIIHLNAVAWATQLLPVYGRNLMPKHFHYTDSLKAFNLYYINKYVDHCMHKFLSSIIE